MKRFSFIAACVLSFALGTIVPIMNTHAQSSAPSQTFYQISFMKTKPGQDALKMERELWKPIHTDRVNNGQINSWTVMEPVYAGPHPYDYITVESANTIDALTHTDYNQIMTKAWGKEKLESGTAQTIAARDMVGNEMWVAVENVSKQIK
jgi:hypothetical protein